MPISAIPMRDGCWSAATCSFNVRPLKGSLAHDPLQIQFSPTRLGTVCPTIESLIWLTIAGNSHACRLLAVGALISRNSWWALPTLILCRTQNHLFHQHGWGLTSQFPFRQSLDLSQPPCVLVVGEPVVIWFGALDCIRSRCRHGCLTRTSTPTRTVYTQTLSYRWNQKIPT